MGKEGGRNWREGGEWWESQNGTKYTWISLANQHYVHAKSTCTIWGQLPSKLLFLHVALNSDGSPYCPTKNKVMANTDCWKRFRKNYNGMKMNQAIILKTWWLMLRLSYQWKEQFKQHGSLHHNPRLPQSPAAGHQLPPPSSLTGHRGLRPIRVLWWYVFVFQLYK